MYTSRKGYGRDYIEALDPMNKLKNRMEYYDYVEPREKWSEMLENVGRGTHVLINKIFSVKNRFYKHSLLPTVCKYPMHSLKVKFTEAHRRENLVKKFV